MKQRKKAGIHTQIEIESTIEEPSYQPELFCAATGTLDEAVIGQTYTIIKVGGQGALRRRLLDMGLTPKTKVMVRKVAPMGDPIELHLRGYELTLRKEDASFIEVDLLQMTSNFCGDCKGCSHSLQQRDCHKPRRGRRARRRGKL